MKAISTTKKISTIIILVIAMGIFAGCEKNGTDYVDIYPPSVPSGVYTITGDHQVTIGWAPIVEHDFDYFVVWRADNPPGPYAEIETTWETIFIDTGLINGRTYFYAVSSVDFNGNESELSYELIYDTPRPEGSASLDDYSLFPNSSGFSFANESVVSFSDASCDIYLDYDVNLETFFMVVGRSLTDIQDFGYTDDLTDVGYAPPNGWSELGYVEIILNHSYIIWTADNHYAVFRVTSINKSTYVVGLDYAYQTDLGNPELRIGQIIKYKAERQQ